MPLTLDSTGCLFREDIPEECVTECTHPGECDADVIRWREKLGFTVSRPDAIRGLRMYGAWSPEELAVKTDEELAEIVLWVACGSIKEDGMFSLFG